MGADTLPPLRQAEAKAFNVFMKKYIKRHLHQDEKVWRFNGRNAWGKLTRAQKNLFVRKPKVSVLKRRSSTPKRKRPAKPKAPVDWRKLAQKFRQRTIRTHDKVDQFIVSKNPKPSISKDEAPTPKKKRPAKPKTNAKPVG